VAHGPKKQLSWAVRQAAPTGTVVPPEQNGGTTVFRGAWNTSAVETSVIDRIAGLLTTVAIVALVTMMVLLIVMVVGSVLRRRSVTRRGQLKPEELRHWRAALVKRVGEASQTKGSRIRLRRFWKKTGLSSANKYVILSDLLERQIFYPVPSATGLVAFVQGVRWNILHLPVTFVRLSDLNWHRIAAGDSPGMVANGDVIVINHSPGAAIANRSPNTTQRIRQELTPEFVTELVRALRQDAERLAPEGIDRELAESLAETLERDLIARRWGSARNTIERVVELASNSAGLLAATLSILGAR
jgi:hypothetical protein